MTSIPTEPRLLTPLETTERLNVSLKTIYRLIKNGKLPAIRLDRALRVCQEDLDAFLENRRDKRA